ncbi:hypothetical protein ACFQ4X_14135 [Fictibacillus halophilus]|uniref:hypothetical protein n=1 Tax=Fictibacillus halophilus TaxID=1610490 RepID=UPI00362E3C19
MKKLYSISLLLWGVFFAITLYRFFQGTGYWNNTILLSASFYILAVILNKGFNKILIYIAYGYVAFVALFILYTFQGLLW